MLLFASSQYILGWVSAQYKTNLLVKRNYMYILLYSGELKKKPKSLRNLNIILKFFEKQNS